MQENKLNDYKMYICVLDEFPDFMTPTLVGHAVLRHHMKHSGNSRYDLWLNESFKKCVVRVNQSEFDKIKELPHATISCENKTLGGKPACVTIIAHKREYNVLNYAKLWKPIGEV